MVKHMLFKCAVSYLVIVLSTVALIAGCGSRSDIPPSSAAVQPQPTPTVAAFLGRDSATSVDMHAQPTPTVAAFLGRDSATNVHIYVAATQDVHPISQLIYGLSGTPDEVRREVRPTLDSWGGNPSTRYNWRLGNAWNSARDWRYRNGDYGYAGTSASDDFVADALASGAEVRLALPMLGWVAKDNDNRSCSFPQPDGECGDASQATCDRPGLIADPTRTSVRSDVGSIVAWVRHLRDERRFNIRFFAMDNEPELWGSTHYDVHPTCTTYQEIRDKYLAYASGVRAIAPDAELLGPVTCCWYFYWNSAAGAADKARHGNQDFIPWFLQEIRKHDEQTGVRTLDVLDIHYYPEGLYNDKVDSETAAHRLRSTRSLWDRTYSDESWINQPIDLIPRMKTLIDRYYPGLKLGISEWNWGADRTMNGALAIADVLGIFGREGLYFADYWRSPRFGSPGMYAFKMYTNYDDQASRFGDTSIQATSSDASQVSVYAARDSRTGRLTLMLLNKEPQHDLDVKLELNGFVPAKTATLYRYSAATPNGIAHESFSLVTGSALTLPAYSITLLVLEAQHL
jgi:hypothetical protein